MFRSNYQGGAVVELFRGQGKNPVANWKLCGGSSAIYKEYDKEVKGFVYCLKGSSQTVKMQMPVNGKMSLGLLQRFLVLQVNIPQSHDFSTELIITDSEHLKKRLHISTVHKGLSATLLHAKIPLAGLQRNSWCTLCIDLVSLTSELFKGFVTLDGIALFATCKVRRIFTMKTEATERSHDDGISTGADLMELIPCSCKYPADIDSVIHVLNRKTLQKADVTTTSSESALCQPSTGRPNNYGRTASQVVLHTAMGSRASGPPQQTGRKNNTTSGTAERNRLFVPVMGSPSSKMNKKATTESDLSGNLSHGGAYYIQHGDDLRNGQKSINAPMSCHQDNGQQPPMLTERPEFQTSVENSSSATMESSGVTSTPAESQSRSMRPGLSSDLQVLSSWESNEGSEPQLSMQEEVFTFSSHPHSPKRGQNQGELQKMLMGDDHTQWESLRRTEAQPEDDFIGSESDEDNSYEMPIQVISHSSLPKNLEGTLEWQQDEDQNGFELKQRKSPDKCGPEMLYQKPDGTISGSLCSIQQQKTRQKEEKDSSHFEFHSVGSALTLRNNDEEELQMLASLKREQDEDMCGLPGLSLSQIHKCNVSISMSSDDTSGWTDMYMSANQGQHYQKEMSPLQQSNPREWMDVLSPPVMPPSQHRRSGSTLKNRGSQVRGEENLMNIDERDDEDEYLSLLYDPCLNCFFDPKTGKYYELA